MKKLFKTKLCSMGSDKKGTKGFTLVELMVVIAIMALLTGVIMTATMSSKAKARDTKRVSDINQIALSLELYYSKNHYYPETLDELRSGDYMQKVPTPSAGTLKVTDKSTPATEYDYFPLKKNSSTSFDTCDNTSGPKCNYYHMGTVLESYDGVLKDDADLDSSSGSGFDADTDGGLPNNGERIYDKTPQF